MLGNRQVDKEVLVSIAYRNGAALGMGKPGNFCNRDKRGDYVICSQSEE